MLDAADRFRRESGLRVSVVECSKPNSGGALFSEM